MDQNEQAFWSLSAQKNMDLTQARPEGLAFSEARRRLTAYGPNLLKPKKRTNALTTLLGQFKSPIIMILIAAAILSFFLGDPTDTVIILVIVFASSILGFIQEHGATGAVEKLLAMVQIKAEVIRDGKSMEIPIEEVVPGDITVLNAGDVIPGDCLILESKDLYVDEAALTGETYPEMKSAGVLPAETPMGKRTNSLFMGTHVISGNTKAVVINTGRKTEFGKVSERLVLRPPETEFEHGVKQFGFLLMEVTLLLVFSIFAVNVFLHKPILDSFLFALALAVGLTPQLLPAIITVNLSYGAKQMADGKVIVKRLSAIENFGSMNILCSDKTGTITEGTVRLRYARSADGNDSEKVLLYAYLNAFFEKGFTNPIDEAIRSDRPFDVSGYQKLDEVPYDFIRKRLSVLAAKDDTHLMITKGAIHEVLSVCTRAETSDGSLAELSEISRDIQRHFEDLSNQGYRVLGVAYRDPGNQTKITKDDEREMVFLGFLAFYDPPKSGIIETVNNLRKYGVRLKVITGDNKLVAAHVGNEVGLSNPTILTGLDLHRMSDEALRKQLDDVDIFAEVEPNQKERIIIALKKMGNVVGYMGDGINDASALHAADVGISVDSAVDVAKDAADIVLLEKNLSILLQGVIKGRVTFANTMKYVFMAVSANFGNMFSMAGASLFLPFLPLLPKQILLTNFLTDFPEMTIASDNVDGEMLEQPRRWNIKFIRNFMMVFGLLSSVFDYLTFGVLIFILHASPELFRTGWFLESVISAALVVLVIRTRKPFYRSKPGKPLLTVTLLLAGVTLVLPFIPIGNKLFGFVPIPGTFLALMGLIIVIYIAMAEAAKKIFYRKFQL